MILNIKREGIVYYVISSNLKDVTTVQPAIGVYSIWTIIVLGSIIVLDSITGSSLC
jgi:hypothetical protein